MMEARRLRLRDWRRYRNLSQKDLARLAGVGNDTIVALERSGHREPWPRTLRKLADALEVEPHQLWKPPPGWGGAVENGG